MHTWLKQIDLLPTVALTDRVPHLPLLGFLLGTAFSAWVWAVLGSLAWTLFD